MEITENTYADRDRIQMLIYVFFVYIQVYKLFVSTENNELLMISPMKRCFCWGIL